MKISKLKIWMLNLMPLNVADQVHDALPLILDSKDSPKLN